MIAYQAEDGSCKVVEYDLRGKKYKDLPDELKEEFDNFQVDIVKHLDCTNEEIAYHIDRYNKQTSMNTNQKNVLMMYKVVNSLKRVTKNRFFLDCGEYTAHGMCIWYGSLQAVLQHQVCSYARLTHRSGHCTN